MALSLATISAIASLTVPSADSKPAFWAQSVVPSRAGVTLPISLIVPLAKPPAELVSAVTAAVSSLTAAWYWASPRTASASSPENTLLVPENVFFLIVMVIGAPLSFLVGAEASAGHADPLASPNCAKNTALAEVDGLGSRSLLGDSLDLGRFLGLRGGLARLYAHGCDLALQ